MTAESNGGQRTVTYKASDQYRQVYADVGMLPRKSWSGILSKVLKATWTHRGQRQDASLNHRQCWG